MSLIYAGDLEAVKAFETLTKNTSACLIDVRTKAEITFVGAPTLDNAQDKYCLIEWLLFPGMQNNDNFIEQLDAQLKQWQKHDNVANQDRILLFLCRSGVRSRYAADAATQMGCTKSYNILGGFEGDKNQDGHRAQTAGWKFKKLPWSQ